MTEVFYEIDGDKCKSLITLYDDGVIGLEQADCNFTLFIYPAEIKAESSKRNKRIVPQKRSY
jgi:hypothetical protein